MKRPILTIALVAIVASPAMASGAYDRANSDPGIDWIDCLMNTTDSIAARTTEPAETVVQAAFAACALSYREKYRAWYEGMVHEGITAMSPDEWASGLLQHWHDNLIARAVADRLPCKSSLIADCLREHGITQRH